MTSHRYELHLLTFINREGGGIPIIRTLVCLFMMVLLAGCLNGSTIVFTGESNNWLARYEVINANLEYHQEKLKITYTGDEPSKVGVVKYKYEATGSGGSGETELSGYKEIVAGSDGNGAIPQKDSVIHVTVEWNGNKEEMELTTK
ncbi:hypothetical protein RJP21_26665 [Paenibacillus sp. VCA1]|uniref:hypothetical protein n=1 Tax=Paenibacillus sp. VCA1 TaxID=3039148 RepID=UPI002871C6F2|nr:hypothetical protein [Paenibacillus sp. VCA1]MDR9857185.1 hypothetical protein [Paenibacillus sp. VCA1]